MSDCGIVSPDALAVLRLITSSNFAPPHRRDTLTPRTLGRSVSRLYGVHCIDFASPLVLIAAAALDKTGYETKAALDADKPLFRRVEAIRIEVACAWGSATRPGKVLPKVALLAPPARGGSISSRYLTPWTCHAVHAVTGALCVAAACRLPGSVAARIAANERDMQTIVIEHPAGGIEMRIDVDPTATAGVPAIFRAGVVRTARLLLAGRVFVNVPPTFAAAA